MQLILIINALLLVYLGWGAIYQFIYSVAGLFYKNDNAKAALNQSNPPKNNKIAVFLPVYKEDAVILNSAKSALQQDYNSADYKVIVIADQIQQSTIDELRASNVEVIEVAFEKSTKSKSLNKALDILSKRTPLERGDVCYDISVILDADNVMQKDFLSRVNMAFNNGVEVLQGRRAAKNGQTGFALLDAASEDINNHILCRGHRALGFSARLAGSGMAFEYGLFEDVMKGIDVTGGFDKELELRLTRLGKTLYYDEDAIIFDEKISRSQHFSKQRSRWLAAQYRCAKDYVPQGITQLLTQGKIDFFNKTLQMVLPPRLLLPMVLFVGTILNAFFKSDLTLFWLAAFGINVSSFLIAIPKTYFKGQNMKMWLQIPQALSATVLALMGMREANRRFIHTPHQVMSVTEG